MNDKDYLLGGFSILILVIGIIIGAVSQRTEVKSKPPNHIHGWGMYSTNVNYVGLGATPFQTRFCTNCGIMQTSKCLEE